MKSILKSKVFAVVLAFAVATPLTLSVSAAPAEAGIVSSIKSAAKKVGGAVKNSAKGLGAAAKVAGGMVKTSAKGSAYLVKDGVKAAGRGVAAGGRTVVNG